MIAIYDRLKHILRAFRLRREPAIPMFAIETRRYSTVVRRILDRYNKDVQISIDGRHYKESDIPDLLKSWCTNRNLKKTIDFSLSCNDTPLFGFHDYPFGCFWVAETERLFVEQLADEKLLRIAHVTP
ncbi:MAG: hypothetical protein IID28_01540 [Planctomycetes bacterium]|nr:hypothetical protein [Planctomycetota bacterium]